jgi:DNA mismatch endonuclease, patch repair protein
MSDVLNPVQRSYCMSRNRGSDTKPELALRRALFALGLRYRVKSDLPGRPDIVFPGARVALFVDGCFWHGCPDHFKRPQNNAAFWREKLERTRARDQSINVQLSERGWRVVRIWEHQVKKDRTACAQLVAEIVSEQCGHQLSKRDHRLKSESGEP